MTLASFNKLWSAAAGLIVALLGMWGLGESAYADIIQDDRVKWAVGQAATLLGLVLGPANK